MKKIRKFTLLLSTGLIFWAIIWNTHARTDKVYPELDSFTLSRYIIDKVDDTIPDDTNKLKFPFDDQSDNPYLNENINSPLYLKNPKNVETEINYNVKTGEYEFLHKVGNFKYRRPYTMNKSEYKEFQRRSSIHNYWRERHTMQSSRGNDGSPILDKYLNPKLNVGIQGFDKVFGTNTIDIKPQGAAELIFGLNINKTEDPTQPLELQRIITFDFDEKIQMGVVGQIGDKMNVGINYNTEATFDFENQSTIEYTGHEDEIIQKIEAGNVALPLNGTLIQGSTTLFGLKTALKFGDLTITTIASQQKGETDVIEIEGGSVLNEFEVQAGDYEKNRHFFLSHYFKENYEKALANLPAVISTINITKVEVWVTNENLETENTRDIVGFLDLAEAPNNIYAKDKIFNNPSRKSNFPHNNRNTLYGSLTSIYSGIRDINSVSTILQGKFESGVDYEKIGNARKLTPSEFTVNEQLGFISLNTTLDDDDVLAVAFEYTINGKPYKVGEFSSGEVGAPNALILKMLKGTNFSPQLPNWQLMMKNVYAIGAYQVSSEDFQLEVYYQDDKTGSAINYLPAGEINGKMLLQVFNLDNANSQLDPYPDGFFDFIEGITIISSNGRIFLPMLEPFGDYLVKKIDNEVDAQKYAFTELYDSTQTQALQRAEKNKYFIKGSYRSEGGSEINLNAMNIPEGSVKVTSGGVQLVEGQDYLVDYMLGRVTILNQSLLNSGNPIRVSLESNSLFNIKTKTLLGAHFDYRISDNFNVGGTVLNLTEKPLTYKVGIGDEPISNTIWGFDGTYSTEVPFLTKLVDKIPFIETKAPSSISFTGEFAHLIPGHSRALDKSGTSFIDDFEGAQTSIDLKALNAWVLASTPQGQNRFPEANRADSIIYGFNRAKLAWYIINTDLLRSTNATPSHITKDDQSNHLVREVFQQEIFPNKDYENGIPTSMSVLNLAYYPSEKGPYNFDVAGVAGVSAGIDANGNLNEPQTRWGGIMRQIQTNDFESANIEYIEFWLMDPFVYDNNNNGGDLYFNLGHISEDILKDSRKSFENGIPFPEDIDKIDTTHWGIVSKKQFLVNAFDNNPEARSTQDVGFDGLNDEAEQQFHSAYLNDIANLFGSNSLAYANAIEDPSSDNYHFFRGSNYDQQQLSILDRYKHYNGVEGNSVTSEQSPESYPTTKDRLPDVEDINMDNTLSENEAYYQYKVHLRPEYMNVGENYITNIVESTVKLRNEKTESVKWYQFKIPVYEPDSVVGLIQDYKSIRFLRMFLTGFQEEVVLRFARLDLVRGEWRKYNFALNQPAEIITDDQLEDDFFEISTVNIEENGTKQPVNYLLPPGVTREEDPQNPQVRQLNEQSIVLKVRDLPDGESNAAYRNVSMDVRQYKKLKMYVHAEALTNEILNNNDVTVFIRLGSDYKENYYEYEIPVKLTAHGFYPDTESGRFTIWPEENNIEITFEMFQQVKQQRNDAVRDKNTNVRITAPYSVLFDDKKVTVLGNPNLSNIRTIMIGVRNPQQQTNHMQDDGLKKSAEIWLNELRLTDFDENGGWAANARLNTKLADFADITIAGYTHTPGFGSIEKKVSERYKETVYEYDLTSQVQLGKFFPQKYGVNIPFYFGYSENFSIPQYNPLDPDIELKTALRNPELTKSEKDELRNQSMDYEKRKSFNITNLRINGLSEKDKEERRLRKNPEAKDEKRKQKRGKPFYHISNFSTSFAYNEFYQQNININYREEQVLSSSFDYNYTNSPKNIKPFRKVKFLRAKPFKIINDMNFYLAPTLIAFRADINRNYLTQQNRNVANDIELPVLYQKDFYWTRTYDLRYKISNSLRFDYNATNQSRVQPEGWIDNRTLTEIEQQDTIFMKYLDLGKNTDFRHTINLNWNTPINKLPLLDWTSLNARYQAEYSWKRNLEPLQVAATDTTPEYTIDLGNQINNSGLLNLNGQLNFQRLYTKVGYLKRVNQRFSKGGRRPTKTKKEKVSYTKENVIFKSGIPRFITHRQKTKNIRVRVTDASGKPIDGTVDIVDENKIKFTSEKDIEGAKVLITGTRDVPESIFTIISDYVAFTFMSLRNVSATFKYQTGNILPGYQHSTQIVGLQQINNTFAPGFDYIAGIYDENFHYKAASNGWLVHDTLLNQPVAYLKGIDFNVRATIEPINNFRIDINFDRSIMFNTDEYFIFSPEDNIYETQSKQIQGNFRISYNIINTTFWKIDENTYSSQAFDNFMNNRAQVAIKLSEERIGKNAYDPTPIVDENGELIYGEYPNGYSELSQSVLIPAFLSAYADRSIDKTGTEIFPKIPLPNWRIRYDGLKNIPGIKNIIRNITLSHAYVSSYNIGSFQSNPNFNFEEQSLYGQSFSRYETSGLFIPQYEISNITLEEKFMPFIGIDISWKGTLSTKFEYKRTRLFSLSFANNMLTEGYRKEYVIGVGYKLAELPINIKVGGSTKNLKSDLNIRADFTLNDDLTIIRKIQEQFSEISAGQKNISIRTSADYALSERFNLRLFYDHVINEPKISTTFRNSNIKFGFSIRFILIP